MWWERRAFPLKGEVKEALLCQDGKKDPTERTNPALSGEDFWTSAPEDGMEEYNTYAVGLSLKKKIGDK